MQLQVPTYASKEDKSIFFNRIEINNIADFNAVADFHRNSKGIYRGISNASYKIYTSLQRKRITDNLIKKNRY